MVYFNDIYDTHEHARILACIQIDLFDDIQRHARILACETSDVLNSIYNAYERARILACLKIDLFDYNDDTQRHALEFWRVYNYIYLMIMMIQ